MPTAVEAKKQKTASLRARLNCDASSIAEKETAKKLLEKGLTTKGVPDTVKVWNAEGSLRQNGRLVHHAELAHFLSHVKDGQWIDNRSVPLSKVFGSGSFYNILYWLTQLGLVEKSGSRYKVVSTRSIKREWDKLAKSLIFGE